MPFDRDSHGRVKITGHNVAVATGIYLASLASLAIKAAIVVIVVKELW